MYKIKDSVKERERERERKETPTKSSILSCRVAFYSSSSSSSSDRAISNRTSVYVCM